MCGIAGIFNRDEKAVDRRMLHRMDAAIAHRGPDGHGEHVEGNIGLANRRLAIIDPSPTGNQPMKTTDSRFVITFNGEIFNYKALRKELEESKCRFRTKTDTEVILQGYALWGEKIAERLIGQFAFAVWDKKKQTLFLARDQLGVNPLFFANVGKTFLFASEVKAMLASGMIKKDLDTQAVHHYLSMFTIPAPHTIFQEIKSLLPGHTLTLTLKRTEKKQYYRLPVGTWKNRPMSGYEAKEQLAGLLHTCVTDATVSDVPVGAFLSGGIDSSAVVALMARSRKKPVKTFSLWAEGGEAFDERQFARLVVDRYKTDHTEATVTDREVERELPAIIRAFDQPTGGSFETYFVSKLAGKEVKVALSGLGGDELFAGYHAEIHKTRLLSQVYERLPEGLRSRLLRLPRLLIKNKNILKTIETADRFLSLPDALSKRLFYYFVFSEQEKREIFTPEWRKKGKSTDTEVMFRNLLPDTVQHPIDTLSFLDLSTYTRDDLLLGMNMTSMASGLEVRVPLLDPRLVEFASRIPPHLKFRGGISKYILKEAVQEVLPVEVIRHKKVGFGLPRVRYMKGKLMPCIKSVLGKQSMKKRGIFNPDIVGHTVDAFYSDTSSKMLWREHLRVWSLFIFELWCREFID